MDRLDFLAEIIEGEKTLITGLNTICNILLKFVEVSLNGIKEDENV